MSEKEAPESTVYTRTLGLAADTLGSVDALATRLGADREAVQRWIAGTEFPPHQMFMRALDIVASGPLLGGETRHAAKKAQQHADRMQASANRVREAADRMQRSADRAQSNADRENTDRSNDSGRLRQVKPKDGAPASNKADEKKSSEG